MVFEEWVLHCAPYLCLFRSVSRCEGRVSICGSFMIHLQSLCQIGNGIIHIRLTRVMRSTHPSAHSSTSSSYSDWKVAKDAELSFMGMLNTAQAIYPSHLEKLTIGISTLMTVKACTQTIAHQYSSSIVNDLANTSNQHTVRTVSILLPPLRLIPTQTLLTPSSLLLITKEPLTLSLTQILPVSHSRRSRRH